LHCIVVLKYLLLAARKGLGWRPYCSDEFLQFLSACEHLGLFMINGRPSLKLPWGRRRREKILMKQLRFSIVLDDMGKRNVRK